jgi:hypothetical protein
MSQVGLAHRRMTSPYHDYFQYFFEAADTMAGFWQPAAKTIGRSQLEMANLSAKQGQAALTWGRTIAMSPTPAGIMSANLQYWQSVTEFMNESSRKLASAVAIAGPDSDPFQLLKLPVKRSHDTLVIDPSESAGDSAPQRRVA